MICLDSYTSGKCQGNLIFFKVRIVREFCHVWTEKWNFAKMSGKSEFQPNKAMVVWSLLIFLAKFINFSGSDNVREIWMYVWEMSWKCQGILVNLKCMNPVVLVIWGLTGTVIIHVSIFFSATIKPGSRKETYETDSNRAGNREEKLLVTTEERV